MATESFFLQISVHNGRKSHQAVRAEDAFRRIHANAVWTRYKLTVENDRIVEVAVTKAPLVVQLKTDVFTLAEHRGAAVKVHVATVVIGEDWRKFKSKNPAVMELIDLMDKALLFAEAS